MNTLHFHHWEIILSKNTIGAYSHLYNYSSHKRWSTKNCFLASFLFSVKLIVPLSVSCVYCLYLCHVCQKKKGAPFSKHIYYGTPPSKAVVSGHSQQLSWRNQWNNTPAVLVQLLNAHKRCSISEKKVLWKEAERKWNIIHSTTRTLDYFSLSLQSFGITLRSYKIQMKDSLPQTLKRFKSQTNFYFVYLRNTVFKQWRILQFFSNLKGHYVKCLIMSA